MTELTFQHPAFAWLLPLALLAAFAGRRSRHTAFVASTTAAWLQAPPYRASVLRRLPLALIGMALVLITVALMDPVLPYSEAHVTAEGLDIVLVLDLSKSMTDPMASESGAYVQAPAGEAAVDPIAPARTRLDATKQALHRFISLRRTDRIGLVVFSAHAYVVSPLTFDYAYLQQYVAMIDDQILRGEGATAVGDGIALATDVLARQSKREGTGKAILVFTDGVYNAGRDPIEALAESAAESIRVHLVGIDLAAQLRDMPEVQRLVNAVRERGGRSFDAETAEQLEAVSTTIDTLERGPLTNRVSIRNAPVFAQFAIPAVSLIVIGLALRAVPYFSELT